jgi:hypothetical protein
MIKSRTIRWREHILLKGEIITVYKVMVRKSKEKKPLGGPIHT